jgi:hypothetical protein
VFFVISGPFMAFRQSLLGRHDVNYATLLAGGDRIAGVQKLSIADVAAMSSARADLMSDLAQLTTRIPPSSYRLGTGFLSQFALVVPNFAWPGKAYFLARSMYNDFRICEDASLPKTDLAGTLVLYSFGEFGWLAPVFFSAIVFTFVWVSDLLVGLFRSHTFALMTVSTLMVYGIVADNQWGGGLLPILRFNITFGLAIAAIRFFFNTRPQRVPVAGVSKIPPTARPAQLRRSF